jgi:hypothetical protein
MKILLSGPPGTGKSFLGEYLATHHRFHHVDLEENTGDLPQILFYKLGGLPAFFESLSNHEDLILTLGFDPRDLTLIRRLVSFGVTPLWLDAPLVFCRHFWRPKLGQATATFAAQIVRIANEYDGLRDFYAGREINVAEPDLAHRPAGEIAADIIRLSSPNPFS